MKTYFGYLNKTAQQTEQNFAEFKSKINWYHPYKSASLDEKKTDLLKKLEDLLVWEFSETKPYLNRISNGCRICGEGEWSCLFITGKCNANCFYCPAQQDEDGVPQTQKLLFEKPENYTSYIKRFGFTGVSFSGGEPLLYFDRTLDFLRNVRKHCNPSIYAWMYTNGILATDDKLKALADAGLNEIRFDLGAVNYNPKVLRNAAKYIENVTVEIPAVPHEIDQLKTVLPQLCSYGVTNLNLHQLRLTKYNASKLLQHTYTFLHGEQPTVAESELTAYEIMLFVAENRLPIGVNYCNFQFKNRFQKAGFRRKMAEVLKANHEEVTQNGFLRSIEIETESGKQYITLDELKQNSSLYTKITLMYSGRVIENLSENIKARKFADNNIQYNIDEGLVTQPIVLEGSLLRGYIEMLNSGGKTPPESQQLFDAWLHEFVEYGMRDFY